MVQEKFDHAKVASSHSLKQWCLISIDSIYPNVAAVLKIHVESDVNLAQYHTDWTQARWDRYLSKKEEVETDMDVLNKMLDRLMLCQKAMVRDFQGEAILREKVRTAVAGIRTFEYALQDPKDNVEGFFSALRSSLATVQARTARGDTYQISDQDSDSAQAQAFPTD